MLFFFSTILLKMHLLVIGLNFKTADISIREKAHFSEDIISRALHSLIHYESIHGSVILSTCNRVEIYSSVQNVQQATNDILHFISTFQSIPLDQLDQHTYKKNCQDAVIHLFKVSSSLDSMVVGEYQIQGQVRTAYFRAKESNATNGMLNKLFQTAIQIGKKVRSETAIGKGSVSVATLAVDMVKQIFEHHHHLNLLLIGAGKMSTLTANYFKEQFENCTISVSNRSGVSEFANKIEGKPIAYSQRFAAILENEVIIVSTSAPNYIICRHEISLMEEQLVGKPRIFIDLSIPRNIDPEINKIDNCFVYSIDDIHKIIDTTLDKRKLEVLKAEKIIHDISEDYFEWYSKQFIMPLMHEIKKGLVGFKKGALELHEPFVEKLDKEQKQELNALMDSYSNKIIKVIMVNLRKASTKEEMISISKVLKNSFTTQIEEDE
jgi:glutamyl-tRNA reductase